MKLATFQALTRLEQSLFGLPMVFSGVMLALLDPRFELAMASFSWLCILPAFFFARISGMAFNQLIDHKIDAKNPRTRERVVASGKVSVRSAGFIAWGALALFLLSCGMLSFACLLVAPLIAALLFVYSYMKRIHASCHLVLGVIHFFAPVMASLAILGEFSWPPAFLGLASLLLIAGSDMIYAIQDYAFDIQEGLYSLPAKWGIEKSRVVARLLHVLSLGMLLLLGIKGGLPLFYYLVVPTCGLYFFSFHKKEREGNLPALFFSVNVGGALLVFLFITGGALWVVMS
ncbi:MAG: 4-hydroxybenzoate octaprenyltransferase [Chlamydiae bacterium]|nr:4-hydroxybenzoate octaprenyltransferase [Chlamydiota bacterium]